MTAPVIRVFHQRKVREADPAVAHSEPLRAAFNSVPGGVAAELLILHRADLRQLAVPHGTLGVRAR